MALSECVHHSIHKRVFKVKSKSHSLWLNPGSMCLHHLTLPVLLLPSYWPPPSCLLASWYPSSLLASNTLPSLPPSLLSPFSQSLQ